MQNYLQPEDDGLPMRETGAWAAEKLDYLARYINIFETSMRENGLSDITLTCLLGRVKIVLETVV